MTQFPTFVIHPVLRSGTRAVFALAFCLFFLFPVQTLRAQHQRQFQSHRASQIRGSIRSETQHARDIPQDRRIPANLLANHPRVKGKSAATATPIPLFLEEPQYPTGQGPTAVATADFNADGKMDLAVANIIDHSISILLGNGDGSFQAHVDYATENGPAMLVVGDFNVDGKPDLAVANGRDSIIVLLGNGNGTFQTPISSPVSVWWWPSLALGDFNGDGKPDLAFAGGVGSFGLLMGNGDGTFQEQRFNWWSQRVWFVAASDLNGDGKWDLVISREDEDAGRSGYIDVLLGNGDGTFLTRSSYLINPEYPFAGGTVSLADLNSDGKPDIAAENGSGISVLLGNGDGTFQPYVPYASGVGSCKPVEVDYIRPVYCGPTVGDFNGDGKPDLAVDGGDNTLSVLLGNGDGTFETLVHYALEYGGLGDFNEDSKLDLAVINYLNNSVSVLPGNGDGTFPAYLVSYVGFDSRELCCPIALSSLAVSDFNRDGTPDLALARYLWWYGLGTAYVQLGNGDGTFQGSWDLPENGYISAPFWVAAGDFNGDSIPDLISSGFIALGNGDGTLVVQPGGLAWSIPDGSWVVVGDLNGDRKSDVAATDAVNNSLIVVLGNGDGTFQSPMTYATGTGPSSLATGDFNGDGKSDLAATNNADNSVSVLLGNGDGTFRPHAEYATGGSPSSVATSDFNGDSRSDLAVTNSADDNVSILLANADGTFQPRVDYVTGGSPSGVFISDFNADGKSDLAVTNSTDNSVSVLLGKGDGTFQASMQYASGFGRIAALGDFNVDESPDLAILGPRDAFMVLLNIRGTTAQVKSSANPSEVGQSVTLTANFSMSMTNAGLALPTGTVAFMDGTTQLGTQTLGTNGTVSLSVSTLTHRTHTISAVYSGDTNFNPHTVSLTQIVGGADFEMSTSPSSATLKAGGSALFTISLGSISGFAGAVSLACSVSPTPVYAPTCSLNPNSVTPAANGSITSTLTVSTAGPSASLVNSDPRFNGRLLYALLLPICGVTLFGIDFAGYRKRRKTLLGVALVSVIAIALGLQIACGGSSNNPGSVGTPVGTYTVTVNAASGSATHTTTVTVSVQ